MKLYNLYYNNLKINKFPLSAHAVTEIARNNSSVLRKVHEGRILEIPTSKVEIVQVTIV
jgi:hypothetical protein